MHYLKCDRHYLVCIDAGARDWVSVRTEYDKKFAEQLVAKAERVIFESNPPERISEDPSWYLCKWCDYSDICHEGEGDLEINCRTCLHATVQHEGGWHCGKHDQLLDYDQQLHGCDLHRFVPSLINGEQIDAAPDASWILYRLSNGAEWVDGEMG